jgi:hypothetical protein
MFKRTGKLAWSKMQRPSHDDHRNQTIPKRLASVRGDGKKYNWLILFESPAWWGGRAEEVARALNEGKTHL